MLDAVKHGLHVLFHEQRKLFAAGCTALAICAGFGIVSWRSPAATLEAYKTGSEWLVFLFAAFGGANVATYFAGKGKPPSQRQQ